MSATTIKIEGELLDALNRARPRDQSLTAFVRAILEREILRRKLDEAAQKYAEFLSESPEEREWLTDWEEADLATPPKRRRR
jgi:hypothetical protein